VIGVSLGIGKALRVSSTGLALEVRFNDCTRWIPKSVIHDDSEVWLADHEGNVVVSQSWADSKGLSAAGKEDKRYVRKA